ncbi:MAG: prolyl oligopeptidase family serine peptidase, partial [Pseudomonadota bacterium]
IDIASRIDQPPTVYLRSIDGTASEIFVSSDDGWARPQKARPSRFEVLAADGKTKIYGNMYRPSYWSAQAKYPIINWIYGSAEYQVAGEGFDQRSSRLQHFAEAGFIVIELDSRGTPGRTKAFNDFGMGAGHNICGAQDHVAAMKQLAKRDPTIDIRRPAVGGHSGGGQCAYRLALREPDFFKATVIGAPSSDPYILGAFYIEDFLGLIDEEDLFAEGARDSDLPKLSADVFIIQGEVDEDVPPASALRLVDQMIAQDKMFELLLIPNAGHSVYSDYVIRRVANFYAESLYGVSLMKNSQGLSQKD